MRPPPFGASTRPSASRCRGPTCHSRVSLRPHCDPIHSHHARLRPNAGLLCNYSRRELGTQQRRDAHRKVEISHALERAEGKRTLPPLRAALAAVRALPCHLLQQLCALARRPAPPQTVVALLDVLALLLTPEEAEAEGATAAVSLVPAVAPDTDALALSGEEISGEEISGPEISRDLEVAGLFSSSLRIGTLVVEIEEAPDEVLQRGAPRHATVAGLAPLTHGSDETRVAPLPATVQCPMPAMATSPLLILPFPPTQTVAAQRRSWTRSTCRAASTSRSSSPSARPTSSRTPSSATPSPRRPSASGRARWTRAHDRRTPSRRRGPG